MRKFIWNNHLNLLLGGNMAVCAREFYFISLKQSPLNMVCKIWFCCSGAWSLSLSERSLHLLLHLSEKKYALGSLHRWHFAYRRWCSRNWWLTFTFTVEALQSEDSRLLQYFFGINITQSKKGVSLSERKYVRYILRSMYTRI